MVRTNVLVQRGKKFHCLGSQTQRVYLNLLLLRLILIYLFGENTLTRVRRQNVLRAGLLQMFNLLAEETLRVLTRLGKSVVIDWIGP